MIKNNKLKFIISSIVILLPMLAATIVHNFVKPLMHGLFGVFMVFPLITLAIHVFCLWLTDKIGNVENQNKKIINMTFCIVPAINIYVSVLLMTICLGFDFKLPMVIAPLLGVMLIVTGNYMPKAVQNRSFGIKIRWTLASEENWNATHRFAGKLWVILGAVVLIFAFLPEIAFLIAFFTTVLISIVACYIYSYNYYKRMLKEGRTEKITLASIVTKTDKKALWISAVSVALIFAILAVITLTGKVVFTFDHDSLNIKASFGGEMEIAYSDIESVEFYGSGVDGTRVAGFASAKLLYGTFRNDEFGVYTRYTYTSSDCAIVITVGDNKIVIADIDTESTKALYDKLLEGVEK